MTLPLGLHLSGGPRRARRPGVRGDGPRLTKGAHLKFAAGSARELAELLRAVAAFAVGGLTALADLRTDSARKLLGQMK